MQADPQNTLADLARDVLYARRVAHYSCFALDQAARELESSGTAALPVIESVILADAEGRCPVHGGVRYNDFPGLLSVMRVYFIVSERFSCHTNTVSFLQAISLGVRLDALDAIRRIVYWDKPLPVVLYEALKDLATQVTPAEQIVIIQILDRHRSRR